MNEPSVFNGPEVRIITTFCVMCVIVLCIVSYSMLYTYLASIALLYMCMLICIWYLACIGVNAEGLQEPTRHRASILA